MKQMTEKNKRVVRTYATFDAHLAPAHYDEVMVVINRFYNQQASRLSLFSVADACQYVFKDKVSNSNHYQYIFLDPAEIKVVFDFAVAHEQMELDELTNLYFLSDACGES